MHKARRLRCMLRRAVAATHMRAHDVSLLPWLGGRQHGIAALQLEVHTVGGERVANAAGATTQSLTGHPHSTNAIAQQPAHVSEHCAQAPASSVRRRARLRPCLVRTDCGTVRP